MFGVQHRTLPFPYSLLGRAEQIPVGARWRVWDIRQYTSDTLDSRCYSRCIGVPKPSPWARCRWSATKIVPPVSHPVPTSNVSSVAEQRTLPSWNCFGETHDGCPECGPDWGLGQVLCVLFQRLKFLMRWEQLVGIQGQVLDSFTTLHNTSTQTIDARTLCYPLRYVPPTLDLRVKTELQYTTRGSTDRRCEGFTCRDSCPEASALLERLTCLGQDLRDSI
jgi:hypothetical protein